MRTHVLILPVKGKILRTQGAGVKIEQNFADFLYGWALVKQSAFRVIFKHLQKGSARGKHLILSLTNDVAERQNIAAARQKKCQKSWYNYDNYKYHGKNSKYRGSVASDHYQNQKYCGFVAVEITKIAV
jgi:hypothetical protein